MLPESVKTPEPDCVSDPAPEITLDIVKSAERLKISVAAFEILPEPIVPTVLPLPTLSAPYEIVVAPYVLDALSTTVPVAVLTLLIVRVLLDPEIEPDNVNVCPVGALIVAAPLIVIGLLNDIAEAPD